MYQKPIEIYNKVFDIFSGSDFDYFKTRQAGFYPRAEEVLAPHLYPWGFIEFGSITPIEVYRAPAVFRYELTIPIVIMTMADRGDPTSLVVNNGTNENKGILDIVDDIGEKFWQYKENHFEIEGINDWIFGRIGYPSVLSVQRLLVHPLIRGMQIDFIFNVIERGI